MKTQDRLILIVAVLVVVGILVFGLLSLNANQQAQQQRANNQQQASDIATQVVETMTAGVPPP